MKTFSSFIDNLYIENVNELSEALNINLENNKIIEGADGKINKDVKTIKSKYFFNKVIMFSNSNNLDDNDGLLYLNRFCSVNNIELVNFVTSNIEYELYKNGNIKISDGLHNMILADECNINTVIVTRLTFLEHENAIELIKLLETRGFLILNPSEGSIIASDKYKSAKLMAKHGVPQPKYIAIENKDVEEGIGVLNNKLKTIYPDILDDEEKAKEYEYVIKILDGHGGTGVSLANGSTILGTLQTIFAIDSKRKLLVQKKEESDGGDLRVHVITTRTEQKIIAAMKRKTLNKDFRSNVSLGAQVELCKLTKEQEEIALKTAKISGLPWCAVDVMPLKKSDDGYKNVILEFNSSPGADGISTILKRNIFDLIFESFTVEDLPLQPLVVGHKEKISFNIGDAEINMDAKFDTGNGSAFGTFNATDIKVSNKKVSFKVNGKEITTDLIGKYKARVGQIAHEDRLLIKLDKLCIGNRFLTNVYICVVDNRTQDDALLNRNIMQRLNISVNPLYKFMLSTDIEEINPNWYTPEDCIKDNDIESKKIELM